MDLDEIIKDLEHTIEYFKEPKTQVQVGRLYQAERTLAQLLLYGVGCSLTDKEKIDYEISQKRKDKEENLHSWGCSMFFTFMLFVGVFAIIKGCS